MVIYIAAVLRELTKSVIYLVQATILGVIPYNYQPLALLRSTSEFANIRPGVGF